MSATLIGQADIIYGFRVIQNDYYHVGFDDFSCQYAGYSCASASCPPRAATSKIVKIISS